MQAAPAPQLSHAHVAGGLGEHKPTFSFRIATTCSSINWFRFDFLAWEHRADWVPVWGAKGIYMRTLRPLDFSSAHSHHCAWHAHVSARNPDLEIVSELTMALSRLGPSDT